MPVLLVWTVMQLGYAPQVLLAQTLLCWIVLILTYSLTDPKLNVNWVFGLGDKPQQRIPSHVYLVLPIVGFSVLVYLPTHFLLQWMLDYSYPRPVWCSPLVSFTRFTFLRAMRTGFDVHQSALSLHPRSSATTD